MATSLGSFILVKSHQWEIPANRDCIWSKSWKKKIAFILKKTKQNSDANAAHVDVKQSVFPAPALPPVQEEETASGRMESHG